MGEDRASARTRSAHVIRAPAYERLTTLAIVIVVAGLALAIGLSCDAVLDITPPYVKIVSPADGDSIKGSARARVEANDHSLSKLQLYLDDSLIATASQSPLEASVGIDTSFSTHRLRAVAYDRGGNWSDDITTVVRLVPRVSLTLLNTYSTPGHALDFDIAAGYLYVADSSSLVILSLANPAAPVEVGSFGGGNSYYCDVHVANGLACVGNYAHAPPLFDVTNPSSPRLLSTLGISDAAGVYCEESLAYALSYMDTFYVVSMSVPTAPVVLGSCKITEYQHPTPGVHMEKSGDFVYVMSDYDGVEVVDVSTPTMPSRVAGMGFSPTPTPTSGRLGHLAIRQDTLYYASAGCVPVADITNPTNPTKLGEIPVKGDVAGIAVDDSFFYATSLSPVESLRVLSRTDWTVMAEVSTSGEPLSVVVLDSFVYLACRDGHINTYKRTQTWVAK